MVKIVLLILFIMIICGCSSLKTVRPSNNMTSNSLNKDLEMAKLSQLAYLGVTAFDSYNKTIEFDDPVTGTHAYLVIDSRRAVLVFRGTEKQKSDVKTDVKFRKEVYKNIRVHRGFLKSYRSIEAELNLKINNLPSDYKFYITGHSLGGALACLAALYGDRTPDGLITFGQPRVGNKDTAKLLTDLNYRRYVNHADAVARMPRINYYHGKDLIYISKDRGYYVNPPSNFMFNDRLGSFEHRFKDHAIGKYIMKIIYLIKGTN